MAAPPNKGAYLQAQESDRDKSLSASPPKKPPKKAPPPPPKRVAPAPAPSAAPAPAPAPAPSGKVANPDLGAQVPRERKSVAPLKQYGVHMTIQDVNDHVQQITEAHQKHFGTPPSPGVVFDLLRSASIIGPSPDYDALFGHVPQSQRDAFTQGLAKNYPPPPVDPSEQRLTGLQKKYPTVQAGMIPASWQNDFFEALGTLANTPSNLQVTSEGQTLGEAEKLMEETGRSDVQSFLLAKGATQAVKTIGQAQIHLNQMMGTKLPVTGYLNQDWQKAISDWMKSSAYFQRTAAYQAKQAGYHEYGSYLRDFKRKQEVVSKHGLFAQFVMALPVNVFNQGTAPWDIAMNIATLPLHDPSLSASYPLHVLTRSAGMGLAVLGGAVNQSKADLSAANAFTAAVLPKDWVINPIPGLVIKGKGESLDQARARAKKALEENHTWLSAFYPDLPQGKDSPKWLKAVDEISNFAIDLILLRKPILTGEVRAAGDVAGASRSSAINGHAYYAYGHIARGELGRASALLEGGSGSEMLSAVTAQSIKRGWMNFETFRDHLAELYATGRTTVRIQKPEADTVINVYHGTSTQEALSEGAAVRTNNFGHAVYVTPNPSYAGRYADIRGGESTVHVPGYGHVFDPENLPEGVTPNIRLLKVDTAKLFRIQNTPPAEVPGLIKRVLSKLTPEEKKIADSLETTSLADVKDARSLYNFIKVIGSAREHDAGVVDRTYGADFANEVLQRAGFNGISESHGSADMASEIAVFNAEKMLKPAFEEPRSMDVTGGTLGSLRSKDLTTKSAFTMKTKEAVRNALDNFHSGAETGGRVGNLADDFAQWMRSEFSHAAPRGYRAAYDPRLPERVHDFVIRYFKDPELANTVESQIVRARALGNTPKIDKIMEKLHRAYYKKYPHGPGSLVDNEPFMPLLESEAGSRVFFPSGNTATIQNPFDATVNMAKELNKGLNFTGGKLRRILIISPSLFWKHAIADSLRRFVGGGFDLSTRKNLVEVNKLINADPELARRWGTFVDRVTNGEAYYMAQPGEETVSDMATKKFFGSTPHMDAAGQYVRVMLDSKALHAFLRSSPDDLTPIKTLIENDRVFRRLLAGRQKEAVKRKFGEDVFKQTIPMGGMGIGKSKALIRDNAYSTHDYAAGIYNRYKKLQEAAEAQGQSLGDAIDVLHGARGDKADHALGQWIANNGIDFQVEKALVTGARFSWDTQTSKIVKKIMYFNKKNRNGMARTLASHQYTNLVAAGWDKGDALQAAMDVAEKQTVYHMLDFSNMLQVEQDLRWLSYFATKHRLYWSWVISTLAHRPAAVAAVEDVRDHLDGSGNFDFHLGGHRMFIPAARLVWVNGKEYPEESPLFTGVKDFLSNGMDVKAFANGLVGTLGSGFQRNTVPATMLVRAGKMDLGLLPSTYNAAISGMDQTNVAYLNRAINHFQLDYYADHGHYASSGEAVKHALYSLAAQNAWRANLPLPVVPGTASTKNDMQIVLDQFMRINDPRKRSKFLDAHPELQAQFGVSSNPADFLHYRRFWSQYTQALDQYHHAREIIYQQAKKDGMTQELNTQRKGVQTAFQKLFNKLKAEDLSQTPADRVREVGGERLGLWGQQISADPLVNPANTLHHLFPDVPEKELERGLPTQLVKDARQELRLLNDPKWVAETFTDAVKNGDSVDSAEARTRKSELLQFIQDFQPFSRDNLGDVEQRYVTNHVNPYWKKVEQMNAYIAKLPRGQKGAAYARLRDWKDLQNTPVTIDGIKFPAPIIAAWQNLPPDLYKERLAALSTGSWSNLADYEKTLLGFKPAEFTSHAWAALEEVRKEQAMKGQSLNAEQTKAVVAQIDKQIPGFRADWNLAQQPRLNLFEKSVLYKGMPPHVKEFWDSVISKNAHVFAKAVSDPNRSSTGKKDAKLAWEKAVNMVPTPSLPVGPIGQAILQDPVMRKWVQPYLTANPDFLNTIINKSLSTNG